MTTYVLWIEMDQAKVFKVSTAEKDGPRVLHRHEFKHHTSRDPKNHKDCEKFFHEIAHDIRDADEILLTGPGLAKGHFNSHLLEHHHEDLAKKVVGMKTLDRMSDGQLLERSRSFFRAYDLMGQPPTA